MAKGSAGKSGGTSRIRFVMVEAEMADGDIGPITQAIQNALRGPAPIVQRISSPSNGTKVITQDTPEIDADIDLSEDDAPTEIATKTSRPKVQRKPPPTPEVLELDLTTEPSLETFAKKANPESDRKRFLVIAAWFKEHRQLNAVTVAHIYTGYRKLKWPTTISDFSQPLRGLKHDKLFSSPERGHFAINHLGLSEVQAMMNGKE